MNNKVIIDLINKINTELSGCFIRDIEYVPADSQIGLKSHMVVSYSLPNLDFILTAVIYL